MQAHGDELVDKLIVNRDLHHGRQYDRADPERQNRVERRHGRTVVADRIDRLTVECDRAGKRHGQTLGIIADHRLDRSEVIRHQGAVELVLESADLVRRLTQLIGSLVDQLCSLGEALCQRTGCVGQAGNSTIQVARDTVERIQNARNSLLELLGLNRERRVVVNLGTRDTSLGIGDGLVDLGTSAVDLCHAVRERRRDVRQLIGIVAVLRRGFVKLSSRVLKPCLELIVTHLASKTTELIRRGINLVGTVLE